MDRVHNDATELRNQIRGDSMPGGAMDLDPDWVDRWFRWYADWSSYYWKYRPRSPPTDFYIPGLMVPDNSTLLPADDAVWAQVSGYEQSLIQWAAQYEQQSGRSAQPHSPTVMPPAPPDNNLDLDFDFDMDSSGIAFGMGATAIVALLFLLRE